MIKDIDFIRDNHTIHATSYGEFDRGVVLCPPHPMFGGNRHDPRLVSIVKELAANNISSLCVDYSRYTGGREEIRDILSVIASFSKELVSVGIIGYSYGAVIASQTVAQTSVELSGMVLISVLKSVNGLESDLNSDCRKLMISGLRDSFVAGDFQDLYNSAKGEKEKFVLDTDHFFVGFEDIMATRIREFFCEVFF